MDEKYLAIVWKVPEYEDDCNSSVWLCLRVSVTPIEGVPPYVVQLNDSGKLPRHHVLNNLSYVLQFCAPWHSSVKFYRIFWPQTVLSFNLFIHRKSAHFQAIWLFLLSTLHVTINQIPTQSLSLIYLQIFFTTLFFGTLLPIWSRVATRMNRSISEPAFLYLRTKALTQLLTLYILLTDTPSIYSALSSLYFPQNYHLCFPLDFPADFTV